MRNRILPFVLMLSVMSLWAAVDYANMADDTWVQQSTGGEACSRGGDVHCAIDKDGFLYLFGGCTYGNGAGGSHNADVYRVDLKTGIGDRITISSKPSSISCQRAQTYDSKRHVCYFDAEGGLVRYQCPDGPFTRVRDLPFSAQYRYMLYDPGNDLLLFSGEGGLYHYDIVADSIWGVSYPFGSNKITRWDIPCCFDTKRGLFVITLAAPYTVDDPQTQVIWDVHCYNTTTKQWETKTPASTPQFPKGELAYDSHNDKYMYFGASPSELWYYDYDSNTWTQVQQNGRSYNDNDYTSSTWPPARHKHIWEYCSKYNVCVNWMGGQWAPSAETDYDNGAQPLWIYRLSDNGTPVLPNMQVVFPEPKITVSPNPFNQTTNLRLQCKMQNVKCKMQIYDIHGRLIHMGLDSGTGLYIWNAGHQPKGIYFLKCSVNEKTYSRKLILE